MNLFSLPLLARILAQRALKSNCDYNYLFCGRSNCVFLRAPPACNKIGSEHTQSPSLSIFSSFQLRRRANAPPSSSAIKSRISASSKQTCTFSGWTLEQRWLLGFQRQPASGGGDWNCSSRGCGRRAVLMGEPIKIGQEKSVRRANRRWAGS